MKLVPNWRAVLRRAWSVWILAAMVILSGLEAASALVSADMLGLSPEVYASAVGLLSAAAMLARVIAQTGLEEDDE
ncbi:hypothetical protein BV509_02450 [Rhodovulum sulfidophilum]|uniref:Uncharacterized protein n=1 Tax=Rhodovulum visakhapatnamense TaxID=364297 RepID=A0ABS1REI7_9RHOB|nr:hypothetical protein [Rhodovulum visakhapatnamense]MBL3570664.1 hypothetical protein [Rhodovulum visakhapatnamense]MBL3577695.1 hypothetical protein [Rhodovulum visakhapatnamense]OLS43309.1 hypothetical protein BV509_02450 [Rhodovulum sulfidophilum]